MPRLLLLLLATLALAFAAAPAQAAPSAADAPSGRVANDIADDDDDFVEGEDGCIVDADGDLVCEDDGWTDGSDTDLLACDDDLGGWGDEEEEELLEDDGASIARAATDVTDACDETAAPAPKLTALSATVAGEGRRLRIAVGFRLTHPGKVALTLERLSGPTTAASTARAGSSAAERASCSRGARASASHAASTAKARARRCGPQALPGSVTLAGKAGANVAELRGTWRGKRLGPGTYRLTATPHGTGTAGDSETFKLAAPAPPRD